MLVTIKHVPPTNRLAQGAGCAWLVVASLVFAMAYVLLAVGINGFAIVGPWFALVLTVALLLFARPLIFVASALSLALAVGSITFLLWNLRPPFDNPASKDTTVIVVALLLPA